MARWLGIAWLTVALSGCAFVLDFDGFEVSEGADGGDVDGGGLDAGDAGMVDGAPADGCVPTGDETSNGEDDDCNGVVDDVDPIPNEPDNCGACGFACSAGYDCIDRTCGDEVVEVAAGGEFNCVKLRNGEVWCFGANDQGQIGIGTTSSTEAVAEQVSGLGAALDVGAGFEHACAISGTTYCWGDNGSGQLADESNTRRLSPVESNGDDARQVVAGEAHTCIRTTTAAVSCAGDNSSGQLGIALATADRPRFATIAGLTGVTDLAAGDNHNCAIEGSASQVQCWGDNGKGQVGVTTPSVVVAPALVTVGGEALDIAAGAEHTCAIVDGRGVRCWGENGLGQLGNDSTTDSSSPQDVVGLPEGGEPVAIAAGANHTCVVVEDSGESQVWCWGDNATGQLGNRSTTPSNVAVRAEDITAATEAIGAGAGHTCVAARSSGPGLWCWGNNRSGQLGRGSTSPPESAIPVRVSVPPS